MKTKQETKQAGEAQNEQELGTQAILHDKCWCGKPAQWHGDPHGLRIFACRACATQQGAEPENEMPEAMTDNIIRSARMNIPGA